MKVSSRYRDTNLMRLYNLVSHTIHMQDAAGQCMCGSKINILSVQVSEIP